MAHILQELLKGKAERGDKLPSCLGAWSSCCEHPTILSHQKITTVAGASPAGGGACLFGGFGSGGGRPGVRWEDASHNSVAKQVACTPMQLNLRSFTPQLSASHIFITSDDTKKYITWNHEGHYFRHSPCFCFCFCPCC